MPAQMRSSVLPAEQRRLPGSALRQSINTKRSIDRHKHVMLFFNNRSFSLQEKAAGKGFCALSAKCRECVCGRRSREADTINKNKNQAHACASD